MKKMMLTTAAILSLSAATAGAATMVSDVNVEADLTAIQDLDAAAHLATLTQDLETAIIERLVNRIAEDGATISVDIDELELANMFETQVDIDSSKLVGDVDIDVEGNYGDMDYTLSVSARQIEPMLAGEDVQYRMTSSEEFYTLMINAFADNVVEKLDS
ncbi:hypothetical protein [Cognatishimia sp. MH4019]|uniref:hypothetical protein n=1 Tax=Cognatishimia sp. MH4019 TaxID=2854030 RepID=UPI001CD6AC68|nr:hypothetical protein [Cognatishimia sp. MH4019]